MIDAATNAETHDAEDAARFHEQFGDGRAAPFLLHQYWMAPGGIGPLSSDWQDKPHRLLYDLLRHAVFQEAAIARLTVELEKKTQLADTNGAQRDIALEDFSRIQSVVGAYRADCDRANARAHSAEAEIARMKQAVTPGGKPDAWQHRIYFEDTGKWSDWRDGKRDPRIDNEFEERALYAFTPVVFAGEYLRDVVNALKLCELYFAGITPDANTQTPDEMAETRSAIAETISAAISAAQLHIRPFAEPVAVMLRDLETKAVGQKAYFNAKQHEFPTIEDFMDEDGNLSLPSDIAPLLEQAQANGRYSEADWWLSTIRSAIADAPAFPANERLPEMVEALKLFSVFAEKGRE